MDSLYVDNNNSMLDRQSLCTHICTQLKNTFNTKVAWLVLGWVTHNLSILTSHPNDLERCPVLRPRFRDHNIAYHTVHYSPANAFLSFSTFHCDEMREVCFLQGTVATVHRCGGQIISAVMQPFCDVWV